MGFNSAFDAHDEPNMWARVDAMLRSRGRSMDALRKEQIIVLEQSTPESLWEQVQHDDQRIDCCPPIFADAIARMGDIFTELEAAPASQLKLISKRDSYMINSWYANVGKLKTRRRQRNYLFMHPTDAQRRQIANGDWVRIANAHGKVDTEVRLT